jgi:hypothetical protein
MNDSLIATPDTGPRILKNQAGPDRQWFRESCLINVREDTVPLARQALRRSRGAYPSSPLRDIVAPVSELPLPGRPWVERAHWRTSEDFDEENTP